MTTPDAMKLIAANYEKKASVKPIYVIMVAEHANKQAVAHNGEPLDSPEFGTTEIVGFFYDLDTAVDVVQRNACDISEGGCFHAAFILLRRPGLYVCATSDCRLYFVLDEKTQRYVQMEEPAIFAHVAF